MSMSCFLGPLSLFSLPPSHFPLPSVLTLLPLSPLLFKTDTFFPAMRLLLPQVDGSRPAYGMKEVALAKNYIDILNIAKESADAQKLLHYRAPHTAKQVPLLQTCVHMHTNTHSHCTHTHTHNTHTHNTHTHTHTHTHISNFDQF